MADMTLLTLRDAQLAYGDFPLLDHAQLAVQDGERIGLIGRNGTGKSTLLKVVTGMATLDDGAIERRDGLRIALVEQEPVLPAPPAEHDWKLAMYLERFEVDLVRAAATGSGGERKRAALAAAFAAEPDLLLLDEPTNHLDIAGIETLQELIPEVGAALIITHDREFLDRIATRIVELDRGVLRSYVGNFARYQEIKEQELAVRRHLKQPLRQAAGAGGSVDPQGRGGAPHPQRGSRAAPGAIAAGARGAARTGRPRESAGRRRGALGQTGRGTGGCLLELWRSAR